MVGATLESRVPMSDKNNSTALRPHTEVLTRGYDPRLSVGSARPAVFRSSTYVFSSPEAAERAFDLMAGRAKKETDEEVDLVYSRFNHPNAEILEDHMVPLESGAHAALVFNSGMAAIMTSILTFVRPGDTVVYTVPIYGGTQHFVQDFLEPFGVHGVAVPAGDGAASRRCDSFDSGRAHCSDRDAGQSKSSDDGYPAGCRMLRRGG